MKRLVGFTLLFLLGLILGGGGFVVDQIQNYRGEITAQKTKGTVNKLELIRSCLEEYRIIKGQLPAAASGLSYCLADSKTPLIDGWGEPIRIDGLEHDDYRIISCGADAICSSWESPQNGRHVAGDLGDDYVILGGRWFAFGKGRCCLNTGGEELLDHSLTISSPQTDVDSDNAFEVELIVETKGVEPSMDSYGFGVSARSLAGGHWTLSEKALLEESETLLWEENLQDGWNGFAARKALRFTCRPGSRLLFKIRHYGGIEQMSLRDNFGLLDCP